MKRHTRINSPGACFMPRQALAGIMLTMAVLTIVFFLGIEIRRIWWLNKFKKNSEEDINSHVKSPLVANFVDNYDYDVSTLPNSSMIKPASQFLKLTIAIPQHSLTLSNHTTRYDKFVEFEALAIEKLFADSPFCENSPFLLVLITSTPENFEQRTAIRNTWADKEKLKNQTHGLITKTVFLVGQSQNTFLNILLKQENEISRDILLGNYSDTYRNLTLKVVQGFKWALKNCKPSYILKTDDDCFVNLQLLANFLNKYNPIRTRLYAGRVKWSSPVIRDSRNRWYVSNEDFKESHFPPYVNGAGYVISLDVLQKLINNSDNVKLFPNEDAYIGTVINISGVRPTYSARFVNHSQSWRICNFLYLFVVHPVKPSRQKEFQDMVDDALRICSKNDMAIDWV